MGLMLLGNAYAIFMAMLVNNTSNKRQYPTSWGVGFLVDYFVDRVATPCAEACRSTLSLIQQHRRERASMTKLPEENNQTIKVATSSTMNGSSDGAGRPSKDKNPEIGNKLDV